MVFASVDPAYSATLLKHAKDLFTFAGEAMLHYCGESCCSWHIIPCMSVVTRADEMMCYMLYSVYVGSCWTHRLVLQINIAAYTAPPSPPPRPPIVAAALAMYQSIVITRFYSVTRLSFHGYVELCTINLVCLTLMFLSQELLWASIWLHKATGDADYLNYVGLRPLSTICPRFMFFKSTCPLMM